MLGLLARHDNCARQRRMCSHLQEARPFDALPDELLIHIMQLCEPAALARCEMVCPRWRSCIFAGGSGAWLRKTEELWKGTGWIYNVSRACPMMERLSKVSVSAMRRALVRFDTAGLTEKSEWMRLLRIKLLWGHAVCTPSPRGWVAPNWAVNIDDCKAAFLFARIETARQLPLRSELLRQKWDLVYYHHQFEVFEIEFFEGNEMTATSHPGARFHWSLQGGAGDSNEPGLQVERFPLHKFSRRADGLWTMKNAHVTIDQRMPPSDDLPLFEPN